MKLSNLRLAQKLALGFGTVLAVVAISSAFVLYQTEQLSDIERVNATSSDAETYVYELDTNLSAARGDVRKFVLTTAAADKDAINRSLNKYADIASALRAILTKDRPELLPQLDALEDAVKTYVEKSMKEEMRLASSPDTDREAIELVKSNADVIYSTPVIQTFDVLRGKVASWSANWTTKAERAMSATVNFVAISGVLCIVLGLIMAWLIMRSIGRPLLAMTKAMRSLAEGDNTVTIPAIDQKENRRNGQDRRNLQGRSDRETAAGG